MQINNNSSNIQATRRNSNAAASTSPDATPAAAGDRVELQGSNYKVLDYCEKLVGQPRTASAAPENFTVSVLMKGNRPEEAGAFKHMSAEELQNIQPTAEQIGSVKDFAKENGLKVVEADPATHTVKLQGSAAQYEQAFGVELNQYQDKQGHVFRAYEGNLSLPKGMADNVAAVVGLNDRPIATPKNTAFQADTKGVPSSGYNPADVANAYNFPKGTTGAGQNIAIVELGGGYNQKDIDAYAKKHNLPALNITSVGVDGAKNKPENNPNGADGEVALDIDVIAAAAPGANVKVYFAPNSEQGFIDGINQAAKDQIKSGKPGAVSVSWGAPEGLAFSPAAEQAMNQVCKDAAAAGVNIYVASGDNGSVDGAPDGKDHVDFPSASPWVVSTGGTKLITNANGTIGTEVAWGEIPQGMGASGGGVSQNFPRPDYQKGLNIPAANSSAGGRGVPDVAGNGAPDSGYNVIVDGHTGAIGGTSAVAPLYAALDARLREKVGGNIGFFNPVAYANPGAFHDITSGNNGAYNAGPGWDAVTGLGTPDGEKLADAFKQAAPKA